MNKTNKLVQVVCLNEPHVNMIIIEIQELNGTDNDLGRVKKMHEPVNLVHGTQFYFFRNHIGLEVLDLPIGYFESSFAVFH